MSTRVPRSRIAARRRYPLLASLLTVFVGGTLACGTNEPAELAQDELAGDDKQTSAETSKARFVRNVIARANTYCRCRPPNPPYFPDGQSGFAGCVVQQATAALDDALRDVTIAGPRPALDDAQVKNLKGYLEQRQVAVPNADRCNLSKWMRAVAFAARNDTRSSGTVVNTEAFRFDHRHPSAWSATGFMAASTNSGLSSSAAPYSHYAQESAGSRVWVSLAEDMSGIWEILEYRVRKDSMVEDPHLCIVYDKDTNGFRNGTDREYLACHRYNGVPLRVAYIYGSEEPVDAYRPDEHPDPMEREVLSLGFRPSTYRGVVVLTSDPDTRGLTRHREIRYPNRECLGLARPAYSGTTTPLDGLRQNIFIDGPGLVCTRGGNRTTTDCDRCAQLTAAAAVCKSI